MDESQWQDLLQAQARGKAAELAGLLKERADLNARIDQGRSSLAALNLVLKDEGLTPVEFPDTGLPRAPHPRARFPIRQEYQGMAQAEAIARVLRDRGQLHLDAVVRAIFATDHPDELRAAKQSLGKAASPSRTVRSPPTG